MDARLRSALLEQRATAGIRKAIEDEREQERRAASEVAAKRERRIAENISLRLRLMSLEIEGRTDSLRDKIEKIEHELTHH